MRKRRPKIAVFRQRLAHRRLRLLQTGGSQPRARCKPAGARQQRIHVGALCSDYPYLSDKLPRCASKDQHYPSGFKFALGRNRVVQPGGVKPAQALTDILSPQGRIRLLRQLTL